MSNLKTWHRRLTVILLLVSSAAFAQTKHTESFGVNKDVVVEVNTSYTNVIFETWNKNKVEVEAFIDDESLSKAEKAKLLDNWDLDILGNSKKVVITSNQGGLWGDSNSNIALASLKSLEGLKALEGLEGLEGLAELGALESLSGLGELANINFDFQVPEIPDFEKFDNWPFSDTRPSIKSGDGYINYNFNNQGEHLFDQGKYKKNKQAYVDKLNKKYGSNISVRETDKWLADVDKWTEEFEAHMEEWGENFGEQFEKNFGPEFEMKMEKWGEDFGKDMEKWGEEFGEKFGKSMEKWGEEFGEDMEKWAEQFEKDAEKWAEQFGDDKDGMVKTKVITTPNGSKTIIVDRDGNNGLFDDVKKAKKTIIIRMPKNTKTEINVRHGEVKMAEAYNLKAKLDYARFSANSVDGGKTLINAAYAPVIVDSWKQGSLELNYVDDCRLKRVDKIDLDANSSDVLINSLGGQAFLMGSFGNLFINEIASDFEMLDVTLENTDAVLSLPNTAYSFYYNGKKSRFETPSALEITSKNKNDSRSLLRGYFKSNDSNRTITINASYSNVSFR